MSSSLALRAAVATLLFFTVSSWANPTAQRTSRSSKDGCSHLLSAANYPFTLKSLIERAEATTEELFKQVPLPGFDNLEVQAKIEQVADRSAPRSLNDFNGPGVGFVSTPAPNSPTPASIGLVDEKYTIPMHVDIEWYGQRESTTAYVTLPNAKTPSAGDFLVSSEYKVVLVHGHGGGTPTATGRNVASFSEKIAPRGIPTIAFDLPGHGRATRRVTGKMDLEGLSDWILKLIDQTVAPDVKVVISGHSWGGEIATYMWLHSNEPKYHRIVEFIGMSPPIDVSLGGDLHKKLEFGEYWERHFTEFERDIAAGDFEFLTNLLDNGKDSDVGGYFTQFTDLSYSTPPLTMEQVRGLKRYTGIIGESDGLCKVGREAYYDAVFPPEMVVKYDENTHFDSLFSDPQRGSRMIYLGAGNTWKGFAQTGHQIMDLYIPGTEKYLVHAAIGDIVQAAVPSNPALPNTDLLDSIYRNYSNFLAFRELLKMDVEYVETSSSAAREMVARRKELEDSVTKVQTLKADNVKWIESEVEAALERWRRELGMTENVSLRRAQEALALKELTPERREQLQTFVAAVEQVDADIKSTFVDSQFNMEVASLEKDFASLLAELGIQGVANYQPVLDVLNKIRKPSAVESRQRSELSKLHQAYTAAFKSKQTRFGVERDARVARLQSPGGIFDYRAAKRELQAVQTPEYRHQLEQYVNGYAQVESEARAKAKAEADARVAAVPLPEGFTSIEQVAAEYQKSLQLLALSYAPEGEPEIAAITARLADASVEREKLNGGSTSSISLKRLTSTVDTLRRKRAAYLKEWEALWRDRSIHAPFLEDEIQQFINSRSTFKDLYLTYASHKADWLFQLKVSGQWTEDNVLNMPPELKALRLKVQKAKRTFFHLRDQVEEAKWRAAILGELEGQTKPVQDAIKLAREVWGEGYAQSGRPDASSLTTQLNMEEEYLEARRRQLNLIEREIAELRYEYVRAMQARGHNVSVQVARYNIFELLNRPLPELKEILERDPSALTALSEMQSRWEELVGQLRRSVQTKDSGLN